MSKPATFHWATLGSIVVPASGKQDVGWVTGERPPAQYMNFCFNAFGGWTTWLDPYFDNTGNITVPANLNVIVSGTGVYKHGTLERNIAGAEFAMEAGGSGSLGDGGWSFSAVSTIQAPIPLEVGKRIINVTLEYDRGGSGTITMTLCRKTGTTKTVVSTFTDSTNAAGVRTGSFSSAPNYTIATGEQIYLRVNCTAAANIIYRAAVTYDAP